MITCASLLDYDEICFILNKYKKDYFPHIRKEYIYNNIKNNKVLFEGGVVIIYNVYKRKQKIGNQLAEKNDVHLKQIFVRERGNKINREVFSRFLNSFNTKIWLSVREENVVARKFYEKNGMKLVGNIFWSTGKIRGCVYCIDKSEG